MYKKTTVINTKNRYINSFQIVFNIIVFALSLGQLTSAITKVLFSEKLFDFSIYLSATRLFVLGNSPYQALADQHNLTFLYPPVALLFIAPFTLTSPDLAAIVFTFLSALSGILALWLTRYLIASEQRPSGFIWLGIMAFAIQTFPFKFTLGLGQINLFVLLLLVISLLLIKHSKDYLGAFVLALIANIKLLSIGFIPLLFLRKKYLVLTIFLGLGLGLLILTPKTSYEYFRLVLPNIAKTETLNPSAYDQSLAALLFRIGITDQLLSFIKVFLIGALYWLILRKTKRLPLYTQLLFLVPLVTFSAHTTWQHHLVYLYPWILVTVKSWKMLFLSWLILIIHPSHSLELFKIIPVSMSYQTIYLMSLYIFSILKISRKT